MRADRRNAAGAAKTGIVGLGIAALAVVCCGALPLLAALASILAIGATLGAGAGILAIAAVAGAVAIRMRRRRACRIDPSAPRDRR